VHPTAAGGTDMKSKTRNTRPHWRRILFACGILLIALIAVLAIWQRDNLTALYMFYTKSGQELEETVSQSALEQQNALEQYGKITVRDLSPEEEAELVNGTITPDEVAKRLGGSSEDGKSPDAGSSGTGGASGSVSSSTEKTSQPAQTEDEIINRYLADIYTLKAEFLGKLGDLFTAAKAEYYALPKNQQTAEKKRSIAMSYAWDAAADEGDCDIAVDHLLDHMTADLKAIGAKTDVVSAIKKAYQDQKASKKAYYYSLIS